MYERNTITGDLQGDPKCIHASTPLGALIIAQRRRTDATSALHVKGSHGIHRVKVGKKWTNLDR